MQHALRFHDEGEILRDAQPGKHSAALFGPGVGADAHACALGLQLCQHRAHAGFQLHGLVQFGDHLAHHGKIAFLGQRQAVLPDKILCALLHSHVQQCGAQIPPRGAAIAAQQCVGGTLPHHGHAVGQGAVHIKDPLLAVHENASFKVS